MNTWGYLILIVALLALAGCMLYARFYSRSRGKSLHHSLGSGVVDSGVAVSDLGDPTVAADDPEVADRETDLEISHEESPEGLSSDDLALQDTTRSEERQSNSDLGGVGPIHAERRSEGDDSREEEEEYLDELQEAAAGLAMLMRSSPVRDRTTPVVFDPEAGEAADSETIGAGEKSDSGVEPPETILLPAANADVGEGEPGEESPVAEVETEIPAADMGEGAPEGSEAAPEGGQEFGAPRTEATERDNAVSRLLGEEVCEKFTLIDEGLDALETLVEGVESRLAVMESGSEPETGEENRDEAEPRAIEEAA